MARILTHLVEIFSIAFLAVVIVCICIIGGA